VDDPGMAKSDQHQQGEDKRNHAADIPKGGKP